MTNSQTDSRINSQADSRTGSKPDCNSNSAEANTAANPSMLVVERVFPHPPEKLWRALTESTLLAQWMLSNDFEPVVGRRFQFRTEPKPNWNGIVDCEVMIVDPLRSLSYTWGVGDMHWVILWTLTLAEGGTHVRMEQSGFSPEQKANYQGAKWGWQKFFSGLERILERVGAED
jgi:uncharacterized protein YndB with AHSA1/START domain